MNKLNKKNSTIRYIKNEYNLTNKNIQENKK